MPHYSREQLGLCPREQPWGKLPSRSVHCQWQSPLLSLLELRVLFRLVPPKTICGRFFFQMVLSGDEDPDLSDALSTVLWEVTLLAQHFHPEVAKYATTIASMSKSTSMAMPSMTPVAAVKEFYSFLPSVAAPQRKRQFQSKTQPFSPFLTTLEARSSQSAGDSLSKEATRSTKKLFSSHFRVLKACSQRPKLRQHS